jgi:hypothetical protein
VDSPAPINEDEMWRIARDNSNGIKPFDDLEEFTPIVERQKNLQAGGILLNETNVEWHKWENHENSQQLLRNTFGDANVVKRKFESRVKPGGTLSTAVGDWSHRVVKLGMITQDVDDGCILPLRSKKISLSRSCQRTAYVIKTILIIPLDWHKSTRSNMMTKT